MKILSAALVILLFSCQRSLDTGKQSINGKVVESNDGVYLFPCHSTSFTTNYTTQPGKFPPFRFTKTLYPSGRVKTINMLSRANPNHPAFKQQAWEVIGTFTYDLKNKAFFVGTKELWEYYVTPTGTAGKKSIIKKEMNLTFVFFSDSTGADYAQPIGYCKQVINNIKHATALSMNVRIGCCGWPMRISVLSGSDEPQNYFEALEGGVDMPIPQNTAVISSMDGFERNEDNVPARPIPADYRLRKRIKFTLTPNSKAKNICYQPTQNWISLEYTICEAMGWLGFQTGQRASVSVEFYPYNNATKVTQSQVYKNHIYNTTGSLLSYTYGDNILQKTTWICK